MKMRIKKYFLPCFLPVIAVLCFFLLAPAFADMKKVDEAYLAKANASVTGDSDKDQIVVIENGVVNPQRLPDSESFNKNASPSMSSSSAPTFLDMNINGQTTFTFGFGGSTSNVTAGAFSSAKFH
jgi:hypothetical protein